MNALEPFYSLKTDYYYRKGSRQGALSAFIIFLPFWIAGIGILIVTARFLGAIPPAFWILPASYPLFAAGIWLFYRWLNWRYPVIG